MGIRMLHRRKAHARVHATAAGDTRSRPGPASRTRPRPALAPGAADPRIPWTPGAALRAAAARLRGPAPTRVPPPVLAGLVSRNDSRWRLCAEAVRGHLAPALGVLGRLHGRRTVRRIPLFVATAPPVTERPGGSAAH
ncbi:hypothetical protein ACFV4T_39055 [Streptomyces sp. NPDC059755]|uniref:hypothetical protein n=1 Tax=Streptomyces sp. NPDC059755 TaxID=3346934 RepID=UPI0036582930